MICRRARSMSPTSPLHRRRVRVGHGVSVCVCVCVCVWLCLGLPAAAETFEPMALEARPRLQAVRLQGSISVDGALDEPSWAAAPMSTPFVQYDPAQGSPSRFPTSVRVQYDDEAIYFGVRCEDPEGLDGTRVPDLRRDFSFDQNDLFGISLDPFLTGRDAVSFQVNPRGALRDLQTFNDALFDVEWDAIWTARTRRDATGWTTELAIPWKSLRYPADASRWGLNMVRVVRRVQERSTWAPVPLAYSPYRMQYSGILEGLAPPRRSLNVLLRPFALLQFDGGERRQTDLSGSGGLDLKWAVTPSTVVDLTANTDFAQAEADLAVLNLTRYDLALPEKRAFFLENASLFAMGSDTLAPFSTRRIGLDEDGQTVPVDGGLRIVSRTATQAVGALLVSTRATERAPAAQFGVVRATRAVAEDLQVGGGLVVRHDGTSASHGWNVVPAADFQLRSGPLFAEATAMLSAGSSTGGALYAYASHTTNRLYVGYFLKASSRGFDPRAGFVAAADSALHSPAAYLDLRPKGRPDWLRKIDMGFEAYVYQRLTDLRTQDAFVEIKLLGLELNSGDALSLALAPQWNRVEEPFELVPGQLVPAGEYTAWRWSALARSDASRRLGASAKVEGGAFYDGYLTKLVATAELRPLPHVAATASAERAYFTDVGGVASRSASLVSGELRLAMSPRLQLVGLFQRSTIDELTALNLRLAWELRPLSFFYLVYDDVERPDAAGEVERTWRLTGKLVWSFQL